MRKGFSVRVFNGEIESFCRFQEGLFDNVIVENESFLLFSDYENQPCVILESLASGIPVIATKVGGIPKLLNEKRGVLIEKNDSYALLEAMKNVLQKNVALESSENLRKYVVENFSKSVIAEKFSEIYNQVLS